MTTSKSKTPARTPAATPKNSNKPAKKKQASTGKQSTILSFFSKSSTATAAATKTSPILSPPPSSDPVLPSSPTDRVARSTVKKEAAKPTEPSTASSTRKGASTKVNYAENEDEDDEPILASNRRKSKPVAEADDSDDEPISKRRKTTRTTAKDDDEDEYMVDDDYFDDFVVPDGVDEADDDTQKPKKRKRSPVESTTPKADSSTSRFAFSPKSGNSTPKTPKAALRAPPKDTSTAKKGPTKKNNRDERYTWLAEVRDADKNKPEDPEYDPRTLFIPPKAWSDFSPFEKQYWEIKCKLYDTVVFFKKGKFYELYEDDARIGHQEFDLKLTDRVNMSMVGVPEMSLETWATQFIAKGYKVARVDQKETALGKEMREGKGKAGNKGKKEEKIIRRELASVLTQGTLVDEKMLQDDMATYCVAIKEEVDESVHTFGIAFVDTANGFFSMTEFADDADLTKFETFVAQIRPKELIVEKGNISNRAVRILKNNTALTTIWNKLKPDKEFWDADATVRELLGQNYFDASERPDEVEEANWPEALVEMKKKEYAMSAFGALLCYLQSLKIDRELISLRNFSWYDPIKKATSLVLDGKTLLNLEIFANSHDGTGKGTLYDLLNRCITPFGKRLFKQWVCHPLADPEKINARLDAVDALNTFDAFRDTFIQRLAKLPDLERLISRIHAGTTRAADFNRVICGFEQIRSAVEEIRAFGEADGLIGQLLSGMPDLDGCLKHWESAFDREKAKQEGVLVPERGVEDDFDASQDAIEGIIDELKGQLKEYQKEFGSKDIKFADVGKEVYQVEMTIKVAKNVPKSWKQVSGTSKLRRFYPPEVANMVRSLQEAQETHSQIVKEVSGRFFARFDQNYTEWLGAVKVIASLDCLISLAKASASLGDTSCRPEFIEAERSIVDFTELSHPTMAMALSGDFIPNDIKLGGTSPKVTLLTGANAAGKSTTLRSTCIGVIMAQIGCYVPAVAARLTPVDRIMSRLGANDNIFAGQSTFLVELAETKKILTEATPRSLVILDELGRGTSSYDGVAVAQAVLHHIATHIGCVGYFATHYHSLATEFAGHPEIEEKRMKIHVDEGSRDITFLYKLEPGVAEGSFGMHCAAMCGIDSKIVDRAEEAAKLFEHTSRLKDSLVAAKTGTYVPLGLQSDVAWLLKGEEVSADAMELIIKSLEVL